MSSGGKEKRGNKIDVVYSTNPDYAYQYEEEQEEETLPPEKQNLRISLDHRKGKVATLITGFVGRESDLELLAKSLKNRLGVGGSYRDGEILIQGDKRAPLTELLHSLGYTRAK